MVHLRGEKHLVCGKDRRWIEKSRSYQLTCSSTPETPDASFGRECRRCLVLIRIDEVVVRRIVQEDKSEANWETAQRGSGPTKGWIRRPGKDEKTNRDKPTTTHHGNKADLWRGVATVLLA